MSKYIPKVEHIHRWHQGEWRGVQNCGAIYRDHMCKAYRLTPQRHEQLIKKWRKYYAEELKTPAHLAYRALQPFFVSLKTTGYLSDSDKAQMKDILDAMHAHYEQNDFLETPKYPDPEVNDKLYIVEDF